MLRDIYFKDTSLLYATPIVQQTAFWSAVKRNLGLSSFAVEIRPDRYFHTPAHLMGQNDMLVILRQLDKNTSIAYVPYGPELEPEEEYQGRFLEELSECVRSYLSLNCIAIRYELCWKSYWAKEDDHFDTNGNWRGEPECYAQEFRFNYNTLKKNFRKPQGNSLPSSTIYINLRNDTQTLLDKMKPKTRYNINLARRKGVTVRSAGYEALDVWYQLYSESAHRNGFHLHDKKYFETVMRTTAEDTLSPAEVILLVAEYENKPLASMFLVISGRRGIFLYGASSSEYRNLMPSYALQWEAIKICKEKKCISYDMFGVAPAPEPSHPLYGLYKFKSGFGGEMIHNLGSWDYPFNEEKYKIFRAYELSAPGFHN